MQQEANMVRTQIQFIGNSDLMSFARKSNRAEGGEFSAEASSLFRESPYIPESFDLTVRASGNTRTFHAFRTEKDRESELAAWVYETRDRRPRMVFVVFND